MADFTPSVPKKKPTMSEEERAALAKKLDDDLDQFMDEMAARRAEDTTEKKPFDFDEWCKEIDSHPAFMTDLSQGLNGKYKDTVEALQAMKYDDEGEEKEFTAEKHKKEGNKHFQLKKYRWAIECYSNGINVQCADRQINAMLYSNRAAANKHIGNNRSAIKDAAMARKFDPCNLKAVQRGAECMLELGYGRQAMEWIDNSKKQFAFVKETEQDGNISDAEKKLQDSLEELYVSAVKISVEEDRNKRKLRAQQKKEDEAKKRLVSALEERKLNLSPRIPFKHPELLDWGMLEVSLSQLKDHHRVEFNEDGNLQWPLMIQYPEVGQLDVLTECCETTQIGELLRKVLEQPAEWDPEHKYQFDLVRFFLADEYEEYLIEARIYYRSCILRTIVHQAIEKFVAHLKVFEWMDIGTILSSPGYQIKRGLPVLMIFTRQKVEDTFICGEAENKFYVK